MENSLYIDSSTPDSRHNRSRSNSHLSSTAREFEGLNIQHIPSINDPERTTSAILPSSAQDPPSPKTLTSAPAPPQFTPFPLLSQEDLDADWSYLPATQETPQLRLDPAPTLAPETDQRSIRSNSNPTAMSTLGIQQYDQRFDHGLHTGLRHTYTWPQFELHEQLFSQNPSPNIISPAQITPNLFEEPKLMPSPIYSRSLSSSPPRANLTPEQRELKRQRDHARRDSKTQMRRERSTSNTSNPYVVSQNTSPDLLPKNIPEYANSLTPSPLLSQGSLQNSPALGSTGFLSPYPAQVNEQVPSDIYTTVFTMGPNDFTSTPTYPMPFSSGPADASLQSYGGRPHSHSLSSMPDNTHPSMYRTQVSPKGLGSNSDSGDHVRVVHSRPKPQCWEHGCNGRQFSTFSNLLRHQREKSGAAQKSSCPNCGAEFTRTTARNGHMAHDKCKQRRNS